MRIKVIACKVLLRQLYELAAESPNTVDILWLRQELHNRPDNMRTSLQAAIDGVEAEEDEYDAIVLGYGLCSNGAAGLRTRKTPLVIPRAHDCITLLLGGKERYRRLFDEANGGIYWFSQGWIENTNMPSRARYETLYAEYADKYGEDNAEYLLEMEQSWMKQYSKAVYVAWPCARAHTQGLDARGEAFTRESAAAFGWNFQREEGGDELLRALLSGDWDEERFAIVPPGEVSAPSNDERIWSHRTS